MSELRIYPPGSVLGILGGGQLGRMTAQTAASLGYKTHVFCQQVDEPAAQVTNRVTLGAFEDWDALGAFATAVDVVTLEWENVPVAAVEYLNESIPVHPGPAVLQVAQHRVKEKSFAHKLGLGTAAFMAVDTVEELKTAMAELAQPAILKTCLMGYDGKGQVRLEPGADLVAAWQEIGGGQAILEALVPFQQEISVIVARRADGVSAAFPPVRNIHRQGILAETHAPADLSPEVAAEAVAAAIRLAEGLQVIGLLAVEMFVLPLPNAAGKNVLINEIAPRPHNSGHWTMDACVTSQFEQLVRAVCGLPLGDTALCGKAVMYNLLGDAVHDWPHWLAQPNAYLHLYGKAEAKPGRKMGHVTVVQV